MSIMQLINEYGNVASFIGILLSLILFWLGNRFNSKLKTISENILSISEQNTKSQKLSNVFLKKIKIENIRWIYYLKKYVIQKNYRSFYFKWRFETYDRLGIWIQSGANQINVCISILGVNNEESTNISYESDETFYIVKINEIKNENNIPTFLKKHEKYACYCSNNVFYISKGTSISSLQDSHKFDIVGLGKQKHETHDILVDDVQIFSRIKDNKP